MACTACSQLISCSLIGVGGKYDGPQSTRNWGLLSGASFQSEHHSGATKVARDEFCAGCQQQGSVAQLEALEKCTVAVADDAEKKVSAGRPAREWRAAGAEAEASGAAGLQLALEAQDWLCPNCPYVLPKRWPLQQAPLWLHAKQYSCSLWSFECPLPPWGSPEWLPPPPALKPAALGTPTPQDH